MKITKKIAALVVASAILASGALVASSAQAAPISGGTLTITPTSGNVNTDTYFLNSLDINVTAPSGFQASGGTFVYQGGVELGNVSTQRTASMSSSYGTSGLDGSLTHLDRVISPTNNFLSSKLLSQLTTPLQTGQFELRSYYFASSTSPNRATDPYVKLDMTYDATSGAWSVYTPAVATTVSLTAGATGSTVNLAATVKKPDLSTAADATGNILFLEGATTVATVPVASGVASASLTGVADGSHTYTAQFVPTGTVYSGNTSSSATVQVGGITATSTINVTVPSGVGTLTLTGVSSSVNLGTAALSGGTLNASGNLVAVVTDTRQTDYPAWNLTGVVGNFSDGTHTLDGKYLGWNPSATGVGTAGAAVLPANPNGLKTISTLATGAPSTSGTVTNASAVLQLKAPSNTPAGAYSATLTLTLI